MRQMEIEILAVFRRVLLSLPYSRQCPLSPPEPDRQSCRETRPDLFLQRPPKYLTNGLHFESFLPAERKSLLII